MLNLHSVFVLQSVAGEEKCVVIQFAPEPSRKMQPWSWEGLEARLTGAPNALFTHKNHLVAKCRSRWSERGFG